MARRVGIRSKLLALVAAPMILLLALSVLVVLQYDQAASAARDQERVVAGLPDLGETIVRLQTERTAVAQGDQNRIRTDQALGRLHRSLGTASLGELAPDAALAVDTMTRNATKTLLAARGAIDTSGSTSRARAGYDALIRQFVTVPSLLAESTGDAGLSRALRAYASLLQIREYAVAERDLISGLLATGRVTPDQADQHAVVVSAHDVAAASLVSIVRGEFGELSADVTAALDVTPLQGYRTAVAAAADTGRIATGSQPEFLTVAGDRLAKLDKLGVELASGVQDRTSTAAATATRTMWIVLGAVILVGFVVILLTFLLSRRITRPLRQLTDAAKDVSTRLPDMVERMQRPGDEPDTEIEPITVRSRDEIAELAEAFNSVNQTTLRVAGEQAVLRGSIAEMFTNMARRNQVLLDRQLSFLDRLEAREEDPDTLENLFRLDHLATRMRRNSESLLVLAGIDAARKLRQPMPLSDVIRSAIGGIENYDRVDLTIHEDPTVSGRVAMSISHLFAELLENATHFSNPESRVTVTASVSPAGMVVVIRDHGLGMTDDELVDANARIAHPPVNELAVTRRLGFFVVGRLAQRLDAIVHLTHGPQGGLVAEIELPGSLFHGLKAPAEAEPGEPTESSPSEVRPLPSRNSGPPPLPPLPSIPVGPIGPGASPAPAIPAAARAPVMPPAMHPSTPPVRLPPVAPAPPVPVLSLLAPPPAAEPEPPRPVHAPAHAAPVEDVPSPVAALTILPQREKALRRRRGQVVPPTPPTTSPDLRPGFPAASRTTGSVPPAAPTSAPVSAPMAPQPGSPPTNPPGPARKGPTPFPGAGRAAPPVAPAAPSLPSRTARSADSPGLSPLAELSRLASSSYSPQQANPATRPAAADGELARRVPSHGSESVATEPADTPADGRPDHIPRHRAPGEVRSMLSGFRAGVQRGREGAHSAHSAHSDSGDSGDSEKE